ncbi:Ankyrin repeats (3 copies) [Phycisphaerae bacterium RAS2]|nr:Ankyrin repeats (3 copies) [Phycisphaerae bacterium RAS2]
MATLDDDFRDAVAAIDAGDEPALRRLLDARPHVAVARLDSPGEWLRGVAASDIEPGGFFHRPYLLWFIAEDPVRHGRLPSNIAAIARCIIDTARLKDPATLPEQVDYALRLVCWSWIARQCGVQIALIDELLGAGASLEGLNTYQGRYGANTDAAIHNGNFAAAEHLVNRGAVLTLTTALCLNRWEEVDRLAPAASQAERDDAFVQAALHGHAEALRRMLALGMAPTSISRRNHSHGTALHHAVSSGNLEAVRVLVEAGANLSRVDSMFGGTPLGWAEYGESQEKDATRAARFRAIREYLQQRSNT